MQTDISIIIVTWNVWDLLRGCLTSIEKATRALKGESDVRAFGPMSLGSQAPTLEVIVVDNAGSDATAELLPARFPWVRFIRSATNLGFTAGNNVGYATSRGRTIYFLNPDTELLDSPPGVGMATTNGVAPKQESIDSLWTLYHALVDNPKAGIVGPCLRSTKKVERNRFRFPTPISPFFGTGMLGRYWRNNPWLGYIIDKKWPATFRQETDWIVGAAMLARREALEEIREAGVAGPFDEGFFMYSEEIDLCNRLKHSGWQVLYVPDVTVLHYGGSSSDQVRAWRDIYHFSSEIRYVKKYHGAGWAAAFYHAVVLNFRFQLLIERTKWLLGHKRQMRHQRIVAYREVLASKALLAP